MRPPGSVVDRIGSAGDPEIPRRTSGPPHGPIAVGLRRMRRIIAIRLNSTKTAPTWGGSAQYEPPRIRGRSHRIYMEFRYFQENLTSPQSAPWRWVCAVYADFPRSTSIRRKWPLLGEGDGNMRFP